MSLKSIFKTYFMVAFCCMLFVGGAFVQQTFGSDWIELPVLTGIDTPMNTKLA